MRGELNTEEYEKIQQELPDIMSLTRKVNKLNVEMISMVCGHNSVVPIAAVCLGDAMDIIAYANVALHEIYAAKYYYDRRALENDEMTSVWVQKFYADDLAFRLYASGEDLANAIKSMLELKKGELIPYRNKRISDQTVIGHYLKSEKPEHPITQELMKLIESKAWQKSVEYRSRWTHEQTPIIAGLGICFKRINRWNVSSDGKRAHMDIGVLGDEEDYSIEEARAFLSESLHMLVDVMSVVVEEYENLLEGFGVEINRGEGGHKIRAV